MRQKNNFPASSHNTDTLLLYINYPKYYGEGAEDVLRKLDEAIVLKFTSN